MGQIIYEKVEIYATDLKFTMNFQWKKKYKATHKKNNNNNNDKNKQTSVEM